jgi:hypothetical protein
MTDPLDAVILAHLDHLDESAPAPILDQLDGPDRDLARMLIDGLVAARGLDPRATRPSIEALLADTPLAGLAVDRGQPPAASLTAVERVLRGVDDRVWVEHDTDAVLLSYLDLRARFVLVDAARPTITPAVRALAEARFADDPDTSRIGVVAAHDEELTTQVLAPEDLAMTVTAPAGQRHLGWELPLPLPLATRRLLEQCAPQWPAFDLTQAHADPLDLAAVAANLAEQITRREAGRTYRGEKRQAYQWMVGQDRAVADLVALVSVRGADVDLDREITRIGQAAA